MFFEQEALVQMIDLFAGCGGLTAGFVRAGFTPVLAVESDVAAAATYAANFGDVHVLHRDIAAVGASEIPQAEVVIGGPPCQGFSNLGRRDPHDPRNSLWREYTRVLLAADPLVFVIENVDRFASSAEFALLRHEVDHGQLRNYQMAVGVLNAADYGVPQRRNRTIVIGSRVGHPVLPGPTHAREAGSGLKSWRTVRHAFHHVPLWPSTTSLPHSVTEFFGERLPGTYKSPELHIGRNPRPSSLARYDCIPPGGGRFDLPLELTPDCWRRKPTGTTDVMGRMRWEAPSLTIRTEFYKPEKGQYLHPQFDLDDPARRVNRPITHFEAARLQTFPDEFLWCGSKIQIARQIGNAVPVQLGHAIASTVRQLIGA